jgi:hypothetical protein
VKFNINKMKEREAKLRQKNESDSKFKKIRKLN